MTLRSVIDHERCDAISLRRSRRVLTPLEHRILDLLDGQPLMSGPNTVEYLYERLPDFPGSQWDLGKSPVTHLVALDLIALAPEESGWAAASMLLPDHQGE